MLIGYVNIDVPQDKVVASKKILFENKFINIDFSSDSVDVSLFEEYYLFVVASYAIGEKKTFKWFPEDGYLVFIDQVKEGQYILSREQCSEEKKRSFLDDFFGGSRKVEIEQSAEELFKIYDPTQKKWVKPTIILLGLIIFGAAAYFAFSEKQTELPKTTQQEQNVTVPPLNELEIWRLKRSSSLEFIKNVKNKALSIEADPLLKDRGRIKTISMTYAVTGDKIDTTGKIGLEFNFPVVDSVNIAENLYGKETTFNIINDRSSLAGKTIFGTSFECIRKSVSLNEGDGVVIVKERKEGQIKLHYSNVRPNYFVHEFKQTIESCPVYIDSISLVDGKFDFDTVVYPEKAF